MRGLFAILLIYTLATFFMLILVFSKRSNWTHIVPRAWSRALHTMTGRISYEAPTVACNIPKGCRSPVNYIIVLAVGYSLEQHKQIFKIDLDSANTNIRSGPYPDQILYAANFDKYLYDAVRADFGVDLVECNEWLYTAD